MTNYKNWDYKTLGFNSEAEMKDSIARVERKMKMTRDELVREEMKEGFARRDAAFSFEAMNEGARLEGLDRKVHQRIRDEQEQAKIQAEREEMQKFMNALAEHTTAENEAKAQKEMQEEKERLEAELQKEIYSKHGVKTDKEKQLDDAYSKLLGNL